MDDFEKNIAEFAEKKSWVGFDVFLIREMGFSETEITDELRHKAHSEFVRRTGDKLKTSAPTVRKWFDINGTAIPKREVVFEIAFALGLSPDDAKRYLMQGIREPSFQINDYQETIYLYGLEHGMSMDECEEMICEYEKGINMAAPICHTHSTHDLMEQYISNKKLDKEDFLKWMNENAAYFKGYSRTTLEYYEKYKKLVWDNIRDNAAFILNTMLEVSDYQRWKKKRLIRKDNAKNIRNYIYRYSKMESKYKESILALTTLVYSENETNTAVIKEVYDYDYGKLNIDVSNGKMPKMTEKRMSDLLGMSIQREKYIKASPQEKKEQKRRCLLIQRSDLLPLIMYVVQKNYLEEINYNMRKYDAGTARKKFEDIANSTLNACSMAQLDTDYILDAMFFLCFQEDDMYSYMDVVDAVEKVL